MGCGDLEMKRMLELKGMWRSELCMRTPMAVEPSLMASSEYSTWKRRPSGEKVL